MLDLKNIETFYPEKLRIFKRHILREYLQYAILEAIFNSEFADKLVFMGGTAIHMLYQSERFSEDLDFDSLDITRDEFTGLSENIRKKLFLEGYKVETENAFRGAYRCYINFPDILYENGISSHKNEKLLIQIDAEPQKIKYAPDKPIINKFDVFTQINAVPIDTLLAQKIYAIANRKRALGRDFFDAIFLFSRTAPDFAYLRAKMGVKNGKEIKTVLLDRFAGLDFSRLAADIKPFLFNPQEASKIKLFPEYIKQVKI